MRLAKNNDMISWYTTSQEGKKKKTQTNTERLYLHTPWDTHTLPLPYATTGKDKVQPLENAPFVVSRPQQDKMSWWSPCKGGGGHCSPRKKKQKKRTNTFFRARMKAEASTLLYCWVRNPGTRCVCVADMVHGSTWWKRKLIWTEPHSHSKVCVKTKNTTCGAVPPLV